MGLSNSQYDAIMRIYNQRQFQNKREQDERVREVYERIPQVEALSDEITMFMAEAARKALWMDKTAADKLRREAADLRLQKAQFLRRGGYPENYLELHYQCPDCRDTGRIDGKKCHCFRRLEIELLYDQSNIKKILEQENFDTLTMEYYDRNRIDEKTGMTVFDYMTSVIAACKEFTEHFCEEKGSILFTGNAGCGKTFLSNCIAKELIDQCCSVVYLTATDMFDIFSRNKFNYENEEEAREKAGYILDCDLLIIDDLGTELINTFTASQLFYCVNDRLNSKKGTIISTNLPLNRLRDEFTERIVSRIMSEYLVFPLIGEDIRLVKQGHKLS